MLILIPHARERGRPQRGRERNGKERKGGRHFYRAPIKDIFSPVIVVHTSRTRPKEVDNAFFKKNRAFKKGSLLQVLHMRGGRSSFSKETSHYSQRSFVNDGAGAGERKRRAGGD